MAGGRTARGCAGRGRGVRTRGVRARLSEIRRFLAVFMVFVMEARRPGVGACWAAWCSASRARSHARIAARSLASGSLGLLGSGEVTYASMNRFYDRK